MEDLDQELDALRASMKLITVLTSDAQARVLIYMVCRFGGSSSAREALGNLQERAGGGNDADDE